MFDADRPPIVYYPGNLNEFFRIYRRYPDALLLAGGTYFISSGKFSGPSPRIVIFLTKIEELNKIHKTERYIEIGACVTLSNILDLGSSVFPPLLIQCVRRIASMPVRNLATVGGNLSVKSRRMDLTYIFSLMDAKIEVKTVGSTVNTRWISFNQLLNSPKENFPDTRQLITRIRLYESGWNISSYHKIAPGTGNPMLFCGLASVSRNGITDFRFLTSMKDGAIIRNKSLETNFIGRQLPLQEREIRLFAQSYVKDLDREELIKETIQSLTEDFLSKIQDYFFEEIAG